MTEKKTFVVVHTGLADFKTITDALTAAMDGDTIMVKIGQYDEKVVHDKSVEIIGDAESNTDVLITGGVVCTAAGLIKNLSVQGCVDIRAGNVTVEGCDISQGSDGIRVHKNASPTILRNTIHDAQQGGDGIYFGEYAKGTAEENEIYNNKMNGVHVNNGEAIIKRNRIHGCPYGVYFRRGGSGAVDSNEISVVSSFGIYIISGSDPVISGNSISNCAIHALMVSQEGKGTVKDNTFNGSVMIKRLCSPTIGNNSINGRFENENTSGF